VCVIGRELQNCIDVDFSVNNRKQRKEKVMSRRSSIGHACKTIAFCRSHDGSGSLGSNPGWSGYS
jgi:hypothetical protein